MSRVHLPLIAAIVSAAINVSPLSASAEGNVCAKREKIVEKLGRKYGESRRSVGLQRDKGVVETFANADTGTWTIIVSLPTGVSCLLAVGEAWHEESGEISLLDQGA